MNHLRFSFLAILTIAATTSMAADNAINMSGNQTFGYELFEETIDHADLETCPADLDNDTYFCRLTLANDAAHVFVFSYEGAQPLMAIRHYPTEMLGAAF